MEKGKIPINKPMVHRPLSNLVFNVCNVTRRLRYRLYMSLLSHSSKYDVGDGLATIDNQEILKSHHDATH